MGLIALVTEHNVGCNIEECDDAQYQDRKVEQIHQRVDPTEGIFDSFAVSTERFVCLFWIVK